MSAVQMLIFSGYISEHIESLEQVYNTEMTNKLDKQK